jgi:pectin methylesterase-like acyl-CoA thioesterase
MMLGAGVLAVLLVLACAAAGVTGVVDDDDGGADFTNIQAAVDAASDGGTTFVRGRMNA